MVRIRKGLGVAILAGAVVLSMSLGGWASIATDLEMGCRPQAMGGAFVAVADDVNAGWWNPAGIPQAEKSALSFLHSNPFGLGDLTLDYLSYVAPHSLSFMNGGFAFSYLQQVAKPEQGPTNESSDFPEKTFVVSIAGLLPEDGLYYGVNLKGLSLSGDVSTGTERRGGSAFDFGLLYKVNDRFSLGLVKRNISASLGNEGFPDTWRFGLAGRLMDNKLILAADFNSKENIEGKKGTSWQSHFGVEYKVKESLALRVGSDKGNFTAGFGFNFGLPGKFAPNGAIDYSYTPHDELGSTSRFSLTVLFK